MLDKGSHSKLYTKESFDERDKQIKEQIKDKLTFFASKISFGPGATTI